MEILSTKTMGKESELWIPVFGVLLVSGAFETDRN